MRQGNQVDQGRLGRALGVLVAVVILTTAGLALGQQRYDLEDGGWVAQPVHSPGSPEGELDAVRKLIAQGEGKKAKHAADDWIEKHDEHALLPEAYLVRGDANVTREHFFKSLFDYEYVIREFSGSEQFHTALRREFELAKLFAGGKNRRLWGMRILPATDEAEEILVRIQERSPGSELGEQASIMLADYYFDKPQMDSAAEAYDLFLVNYPQSEQREWAMLRLIQANLARFKGPRFDATGLIDAGQRLKTFRADYPASAERIGVGALLIRIDESLAMRDMIAAGWHIKRKQELSAIYLYQRVVVDYPQTAAAQDAVRQLQAMGAPVLPSPPEVSPEPYLTLPADEPAAEMVPAAVDNVVPVAAKTQPELADTSATMMPAATAPLDGVTEGVESLDPSVTQPDVSQVQEDVSAATQGSEALTQPATEPDVDIPLTQPEKP